MAHGPFSDETIVIPKGAAVDDRGYTEQDYEAIRRSRVKHAISLLGQNGIRAFFLVSVEEILALDDRISGRQAAAVLDLALQEYTPPDYKDFFAPFIERVRVGDPDEDPKPS
jgi:hypothetical protein